MGKKIDAFVMTVLIAICFYLYFWQATGNHALAIGAALLCCLIAVKTIKRVYGRVFGSRSMKMRRFRKQSEGIIMKLACADRNATASKLEALLQKCFPDQFSMDLIQAHPDERLSMNTVFEAWKRRRGDEKLVICATCSCDPEVRMMASSLSQPRVAIVDSERLMPLLAEHPEGFQPVEAKGSTSALRRQRLLQHTMNRKNAPRCILFGFSSLVMYVFSGNLLYLISAMLLFLLAFASFRRAPVRAKLF